MADTEAGNYKLVESEPPVTAGGRWFKAASVVLLGTTGLVCAFSNAKPSNSRPSLRSASVDVTDLESSSPPVVYLEDFTSMSLPVTPGKVNGAFYNLPGKDLSAGLYRLDAGNSVSYTYRYPEFKYIVEGEWHLTDGTGQEVHATAGDLLYFPMGTKVDFTVAETGLGYYIADARNANHTDPGYGLAAAMALNPRMVHFAQIAERGTNGQVIACDSRVPGLEMTAGLGGGDSHGTQDHEEFALVLTGEFAIEDGTGQTITAKAGDLVYTPTGSQISASTSAPSQFLWSGLRYVTGDSCGTRV